MSLVINRDEINSILLPDSEDDAITILIKQIKGAVAVSIEGDDWLVLVRQGDKFVWMDITETLAYGSDKDYSDKPKLSTIKPP